MTSWIETRDGQVEKANLTILFDKYIPTLQDAVKYRFKKITPIPEICHIQTLCRLLECLIVGLSESDCFTRWKVTFSLLDCWTIGK